MINGSNTPENERDLWRTPPEIIEVIKGFLNMGIALDACAANAEVSVAHYFISPEQDALSNNRWPLSRGQVAFMNPPYSKPATWCARASLEAFSNQAFVVGLLPDDRSTKWYQEHIEGVASLALLPNKRISFLRPDGSKGGSNNRGSVIPVWTPWRTTRTEYIRVMI